MAGGKPTGLIIPPAVSVHDIHDGAYTPQVVLHKCISESRLHGCCEVCFTEYVCMYVHGDVQIMFMNLINFPTPDSLVTSLSHIGYGGRTPSFEKGFSKLA